MIKGILYKYLLKALVIALLGLILFGVVPGLSTVLLLFVGLRFTYLAAEAVRKPLTSQQQETLLDRWTRHYEKFQSQRLSIHNNPLKLSARQLAEKQVNRVVQSYAPPRPRRELAAEALGVTAWAVLIPLVIALYTRDFFSLRTPQGWAGAGVVVLCLGVYAWPFRGLKSSELSDVRILWWIIPFVVALPLLTHVIHTRHPYLDPFNPDQDRLAAERVLALKNNVVAGHHADWVLRYARQLDQRGDSQSAIRFYREGLRLDANELKAYARLAALESASATNLTEAIANPDAVARALYWTDAQPIIPSPRGQIDSQLENVAGCTVVIVPVGKVSDKLLDAIGHVRWMKSGGDTATIRSFLIAWIRNNATQKDADLVYRKWLAAGGDIPAVLQPVQAWLQKHQSEASARYMFSSWLESGGNAADIADSLKSWLTIHHKTLEACFVYPRWLEHTRQCDFIEPFIHSWIEINSTAFDARFVYETWLAAGGSREDVREPIRRWLAEHEKTSEARFVYDAWFDSTREVEFLRASLSRWLLLHDTEMESDHAMRSWLDAGGDKEIVRAHLANWLAIHRITSEASFVFQSWLKAGGDKAFVQPAIQDWLKQHSTHENARYVCTAWLDVGGEFDLAHDATLIRFQNHTADLDTQFEYRAWLEGGGSRQEVMPFLVRWLAVNHTALEARFVYKAWLEAGGDKNLMRFPVRAWLEKHGLTYEASFVYPAWLKAGGEVDLVAEFIEQWLKHYDTIEDASFIYEFWLIRGGDKSLVRPHIRSWLAMHSEIPQARFVYKTWLEAGGEFALIELSVLRWMEKNRANADSIFITRLIAREKHLSDQTLKRLVAWTGKMPEKDKCVSSFSQLGKHLLTPSLRNEIVVAAEQLLMPLLNNGLQLNGLVQGDTAIVISYLLDFSRGQTDAIRQRIDNLFLLWLRHPRALSFETKRCENIQRVEWLRRIGDLLESGHLNVERDRLSLERFLHWVDSWEGWRKSQHQTISAIESLKQRFPAPRLWSLVRLLPQFHQQSTRGKGYRYR